MSSSFDLLLAGAGRQVQVDPFIIGFEVTTQYGAIKLGEREWIRTIENNGVQTSDHGCSLASHRRDLPPDLGHA